MDEGRAEMQKAEGSMEPQVDFKVREDLGKEKKGHLSPGQGSGLQICEPATLLFREHSGQWVRCSLIPQVWESSF